MTYRSTITSAAALGIAVQQSRMAAGVTQRELADRLGVSQRYVWELESGKESLVLSRLFEMLRETGATMIIEVPEGPDD